MDKFTCQICGLTVTSPYHWTNVYGVCACPQCGCLHQIELQYGQKEGDVTLPLLKMRAEFVDAVKEYWKLNHKPIWQVFVPDNDDPSLEQINDRMAFNTWIEVNHPELFCEEEQDVETWYL